MSGAQHTSSKSFCTRSCFQREIRWFLCSIVHFLRELWSWGVYAWNKSFEFWPRKKLLRNSTDGKPLCPCERQKDWHPSLRHPLRYVTLFLKSSISVFVHCYTNKIIDFNIIYRQNDTRWFEVELAGGSHQFLLPKFTIVIAPSGYFNKR